MRSVLSISVPSEKRTLIRNRARRMRKTVSSYLLYTVELEQQLISEEELFEISKKADMDYKNGKTKEVKSLADLIS